MTAVDGQKSRDKPVCGAKTRGGGDCRRPAGWGTPHPGIGACKLHGGSMPNHIKHAAAVQAQRTVAEFAAPISVEPTEAMLGVLAIRWGMVHFLTGIIADMESTDELKQLSIGAGREKFERPAVWVEMLDNALRECARVAKACADMGIDERRQRLAEGTGRELIEVIRKLLDGIQHGLTARGMPADELAAFWRDEVPRIVQSSLAGLLRPRLSREPAMTEENL